jgi:hypothetical protein
LERLARDCAAPSLKDEHLWARVKFLAPSDLRYSPPGTPRHATAREKLLSELDRHIQKIRTGRPVRYSINNRVYSLSDFQELKEFVVATPIERLAEPWPTPDDIYSQGIWAGYDMGQLIARTIAVYGAALDAYRHIVQSWFSKFAPTLELAILSPIHLKGLVECDKEGPGIHYEIWPRAGHGADRFEIGPEAQPRTFVDIRAHYRNFVQALERHRRDGAAWVRGFEYFGVLDIFGDRPATELAFKWLWDDLQALHLADSSPPNLRL